MTDPSKPFVHEPVMRSEIIDLFAPVPEGLVIDATVGGGGHADALLRAHPQLSLLGLDQDADALEAAAARLAPHGPRVTLRRARFDQLATVVMQLGHNTVAGVLFDLGVSSPQLDRPERGFSYREEGPLDMRMDPRSALTAADVVNEYAELELVRVLREHGDERFAARIAKAIVAARPIMTTTDLAEIIRDAIPAAARRTGGHPAKRSFQAIRIEVNAELDILGEAIDQGIEVLTPGGRIAVLAYHSGEDRIVKDRLREASSTGVTPPPGLPVEPDELGRRPRLRLLKRGAWKPSADEVEANPRAQSARLRAGERLEDAGPDDGAPPGGTT